MDERCPLVSGEVAIPRWHSNCGGRGRFVYGSELVRIGPESVQSDVGVKHRRILLSAAVWRRHRLATSRDVISLAHPWEGQSFVSATLTGGSEHLKSRDHQYPRIASTSVLNTTTIQIEHGTNRSHCLEP